MMCKWIFNCLAVADLFRLRATSHALHDVVTEYFCNIDRIVLSAHEEVDSIAFEIMTKNNASLKVLVIPQMGKWITDDQIIAVFRNCPNLRVLALTECMKLSNRSLDTLAETCCLLTDIDLCGCTWIDGYCFSKVISNNTLLQSVNIRRCTGLDDSSFELIGECLPELKILDMSENSALSDKSLHIIGKRCHNLTHLSIIGCWRVSDSSVRILSEYCKQLEVFNCSHCREISERALNLLRINGIAVDVEALQDALVRLENYNSLHISSLVPQIHHNM